MSRSMFKHPIFAGHPERVAAWAWILAKTAWKDTRQDANGKTVTVRRGQLLTSYRQMSSATGVSVKTLRGLISRLQAEDTIDTDKGTGRLLITIRNYNKYQSALKPEGTAEGTGRAQEGHRKGTQKKQGNKGTSIPVGADKPADPAKIMFDSGITFLCGNGMSEQKARRLLGKWKADHGAEAVITALGRAQREGAIEPVSFIEGCFKFQAKKERPEPGERRIIGGKQKVYVNHFEGWMNEIS